MATVWCVFAGSYEDRALVAVYATLAGAQAMTHGGHQGRWPDETDHMHCEWELQHFRARVPIDITLDTEEVPVIDGVATLRGGRRIKVDAGVQTILVPVLPEGAAIGPVANWTDTCDYEIEAHELLA